MGGMTGLCEQDWGGGGGRRGGVATSWSTQFQWRIQGLLKKERGDAIQICIH